VGSKWALPDEGGLFGKGGRHEQGLAYQRVLRTLTPPLSRKRGRGSVRGFFPSLPETLLGIGGISLSMLLVTPALRLMAFAGRPGREIATRT